MVVQIKEVLQRLSIGVPRSFRAVTMVPLFAETDIPASYLTLDEALARSLARVTEVSEGGSVPELWFENYSDKPVLLVDGEELVGARQNRIVNLTILVGPLKKIRIPVSCVERGRWAYVSQEFRSADRTLYASARAAKIHQVSQNLRHHGSCQADQRAIWQDIAAKSSRMRARSRTEAMSDLYEQRRRGVDAYRTSLQPEPKQVGVSLPSADSLMESRSSTIRRPSRSCSARSWRGMRWMRSMGRTAPAGKSRSIRCTRYSSASPLRPLKHIPSSGKGSTCGCMG